MFLRGSSTRYRDSSSRAHFLKNFLPLSYGQCLKSARFITIYRWYGLSYFFWKQTSFYGWRYRYKPFHLSPTTPMMQKGITEDMEFSRIIYDFYNNKPPFLNFWKTKLPFLFLNFEKRNSLCQHFHARLPCFDKENRCLMLRLDEAKCHIGLYFTTGPHLKILKNKTPFIVSAGTPLFLDRVQKVPFSHG